MVLRKSWKISIDKIDRNEETCDHCLQIVRKFRYFPGRSAKGKKFTLALCKPCYEAFYSRCKKCGGVVKKWDLIAGKCRACQDRLLNSGQPEQNIDERIRILALRPLRQEKNIWRGLYGAEMFNMRSSEEGYN